LREMTHLNLCPRKILKWLPIITSRNKTQPNSTPKAVSDELHRDAFETLKRRALSFGILKCCANLAKLLITDN
jgi:hypothetical protein